MKKLSKKTMTGLGLTFGLVAVGAFIVVTNPYKQTNSDTNKAFNKEMLSYAEKTVEEAEKEVEQAEEKVEIANKEVEKAEQEVAAADEKVKEANNKVTVAEKENQEAEKQLEEAKAELETADTDEAKKIAQTKVDQATKAKEEAQAKVEEATEAATKAAEEKKAAEEEAKKAQEEKARAEAEQAAKEVEAERLKAEQAAKEADKKAAEEAKRQAEMEAEKQSANVKEESNSKTTDTQENKVSEEKNNSTVDTIIQAAKKTQDANSLTIYDITNKWAKKYNKTNGNELITYYSGSAASNGRSGVLYSYTSKSNGTSSQKSLFKPMEASLWAIPSADSIKGDAKIWEMQFSGKRTVGVPELELLKKGITGADLYRNASTLVTKSANELLQNVSYYKVTISEEDVIEWLKKYYNVNEVTAINNDNVESVQVIVGISNGYVTYISNVNNNSLKGFQIMTGENGKFTSGKYLKFEVVLTKANNTSVPTLADVGLNENSVTELEEEYKAHYGCKKEWTSSEKYGDYYYWVCNP